MWNDTDIPLAYLITFRCYGRWLHGDPRGSVDREHNQYKTPYAAANENRYRHNRRLLKSQPVLLDAPRRASVETAIRDTCTHRRWILHAMNVRTNHVHVVVSIGAKKPKFALSALKANATRQMRQDAVGKWITAHGLIKEANGDSGMSVVWRVPLTMLSTARVTTCRNLIKRSGPACYRRRI
jgi:REP element-mobilizing transposase RayT